MNTTATLLKSSDLRVNNWVHYPNTKPFQITESTLMDQRFWNDLDILQPVELTPDILYLAGWHKERIGDYDYYITPEGGFASNFPIWWYRDEICIAPMGIDTGHISIKYLHHLQNIVHALTGQELQINL